MPRSYALAVTEMDTVDQCFRTLGGAAWPTKAERDAALARIPELTVVPSGRRHEWIVDVLAPDGTITADRCVSEDTVKRLLATEDLQPLRDKADAEMAAFLATRRSASASTEGSDDER